MRHRTNTDRDGGFTLLEMIVVVVILALAGGLVLAPGPMRSATIDLRAAARTMAADMRSTRARAIGADRTIVFTLDTVHADYGSKDGPRHALPRGVVPERHGASPVPEIVFRPDGSSSGGSFTLREGDRHIEIATDWLTGAVSVR